MKPALKVVINIFLFIILVYVLPVSATPQVTTYQAKILRPDGLPLDASSVSFKFTILSPDANCILYSETYASINLSGTGGMVAMPLGTGTRVYPASATTFAQVFNNSTPSLDCAPGGPADYQPGATDVRKIVMQFNDGNGWQTLPAMSINAVPYAIYASDSLSLGGVSATSYVKYSTIPTCTASQALQYTGASFNCVAVGSGGSVTAGDITTALGYTPQDPAIVQTSFTTVTNNLGNVSSTVTSLSNSVAASFAALTGAGLQSLNGSTSGTQSFVTGVAGNAPAFATANGVHTLNIPLAASSSVTAGLLSNADYLTFTNKVSSTSASVIAALGYVPANNSASGTYAQKANNLSDLASATAARTNLGLGSLAILNFVDLSGSQVSGTLAEARLPAFSGDASSSVGSAVLTLANVGVGVASGSQYTKVTVDGKGRVTSGAQLSTSDVTTALGYTPANSATIVSSQWNTSGTTINYMSGNVGIGTTTPSRKLTVKSSSNTVFNSLFYGTSDYGIAMNPNNGSSDLGPMITVFNGATNHQSSLVLSSDNSQPIIFATAWSGAPPYTTSTITERMRLSGDGSLGVGTTTPVTKLDVSGGVRISMEAATCATSYAGTLRYNSGNVEYCNGTAWSAFGVAGAGITNFNGSVSGSQTLGNGTTGTQPAYVTVNGVHTLNIPYASAGSVTAGLISSTDYLNFSNKITSSAASIAQVLGYIPASATALESYLVKANNLSDLTSSETARTNLGLGGFATISSLDLSTASATGILAVARLPSLVGDVATVSGSNSVTVDGLQGRNLLSTAPSSGQVLAYNGSAWAPATAGGASQWTTSGTTINYTTGNVGIGTTAPAYPLQVTSPSGVNLISQFTNSNYVSGATGSTLRLVAGSDIGNTNFRFQPYTTGGTVYGELDLAPYGGKVGIGVDGTAKSALDVNGGISAGSYAGVTAAPSNGLIISGNVGIGTSSPSTTLEVAGTVKITGGTPGTGKVLTSDVSGLASWQAIASAVTSLNGSTSATQTFAITTAGTSFGIATANGVHTLIIPLASAATTAGLLSNADYLTFANKLTTLDLGSVSATGTLAIARLPAFTGDVTGTAASNTLTLASVGSGVTSGTQYTKVTVDGKGRVTSGTQLASADVTTALGYTPANSATTVSSQWNTSGTTINYMNGNVGVGTTAPGRKMHIKFTQSGADEGLMLENLGNAGANLSLKSSGAGGREYMMISTGSANSTGAGYWGLFDNTGSAYRMVVNSSGNVGIGTNSPSNKLTVAGNANFTGNVGIGTTSPSQLLSVNGAGHFDTDLGVGAVADATIARLRVSANNTSAGFYVSQAGSGYGAIFNGGNVGVGTTAPSYTLDVSGTLRVTGQAYTNTGNGSFSILSDVRYKDVHGSFDRGLVEILNINIIKFNYKKDNPLGSDPSREYVGVSAQNLQQAIPEAVEPRKVGKEEYLTINTSPVLWTLINAVKQLYKRLIGVEEGVNRQIASIIESKADKAEIEVLREKSAVLEAENTELKNKAKEFDALKAYLCSKDPAAPICK